MAESHVLRSSPAVLALVRPVTVGCLLPRMVWIWSVGPWVLGVPVGRSILRIVWRYCWEGDVVREWHSLVIRSCTIVFLARWRRIFCRRRRILRLDQVARISCWRIWSTWLVRVRHVWIDRHVDGLDRETTSGDSWMSGKLNQQTRRLSG